MSDDCISVEFEDGTTWDYCWEDSCPDPNWDSTNVDTGLRPSQADRSRSWRTCQYYLKGMSAICRWWREGQPSDPEGTTTSGSFYCAYIKENTSEDPQDPKPETPSGFNNTYCDFLGRRHWCSHYEGATEDNLDEWICVAPNPYLTGLGRKTVGNEAAIFRSIPRSEIWGYNDKADGTGTGQCDCYGMGRGCDGCKIDSDDLNLVEKNLSKLPIVCNFYRPWQMGFGIIDPQTKEKGDVEADRVTITEQGWAHAEQELGYRLPLNYKLYNVRAQFQKCQWWEEDTGRDYMVDNQGFLYLDGDPDIFDANGKVEFCKCTDSYATPYNTRALEDWISDPDTYPFTSQMALEGIWAKGGGPVCNGACPECPCYSGKWLYLSSEKMYPGMPVTANQILELRFWSQDWDSQEEYDNYFLRKPNFDDPETASIYTFTKWTKYPGETVNESNMVGKKLSLCQPAPLHNKEFTTNYIIEESPINYYNVQIGTSTADTQRHFPSLIRDPNFPELKPLVITYPYYNDDVFNSEICVEREQAGHLKKHNNIYGDAVKTIGQTIRNKKVYTINTEEVPVSNLLKLFAGVYAVKDKNVTSRSATAVKNDIYNLLRATVSLGLKDYPDYIKMALSDDVFGYFLVDSVKLKYNVRNLLLICVDYGDGTWEYRWREVVSKWYGGVVKQTKYEHEYGGDSAGYSNPMPVSINPTADITAKVVPLGAIRTINPFSAEVYSTYSIDNANTMYRYYNYSIQEITETESLETYWGAVGNTNKILVELSDLNINYVYDWDVLSAELRAVMVEDDEGNSTPLRGENTPTKVTLSKVLVDDNHIPPNACLFEPANDDIRIRFLPSEWELYVTYKYEKITNDYVLDNIIYGANKTELDRYSTPSYSLTYSDDTNTISVDAVSTGAVQLMTHFKDEDGRIISAFATKLLVNIIRESCRNVDIFYRYEAMGRQYKLMPEYGFCVNLKQDMPMHEPYKHVETPSCGDHEQPSYAWSGPLWFPFDVCLGYNMYDEFTVCNNCQAGYIGPINDGVKRDDNGDLLLAAGQVVQRYDYRYCGPHKYKAFGESRGNWVAACNCGCRFWYSDASASTVLFSGYARRKTTVDLRLYALRDWTPPPFGNEGRELVEKFLSQDYVNTGQQGERFEWVPLMMDHSVFFSTFNAYDDNPEDEYYGLSEYYGYEPFRYVNQLNMGLLSNINEEIVREEDPETGQPTNITKRFRWDELFEVHHEGNCSYPKPAYLISNTIKAVFYYFKEDWHSWAWQEAWKDIERNLSVDLPETPADAGNSIRVIDVGKLDFVDIIQPLYVFDYYKTEHRRVMDEGQHVIVYTAPEMDDDGNMVKYPSLSINGHNERPFEILYDEDSYISTNNVDWKNEGGSLNTQAGSSDDNIYEKASGGDWIHSENILFDNEAVETITEAETAGRKITSSYDDLVGEFTYKYFNRGLIAEMTRDKLYYLPKKEVSLYYSSLSDGVNGKFEAEEEEITINTNSTPEYLYKTERLVPGTFVWDDESVVITSISEGRWAFGSIQIRGSWGYSEGLTALKKLTTHKLVMPAVSLSYTFEDGSSGYPRSQHALTVSMKEPEEDQAVENYTIYLDFLLGPVEMLTKRVSEFNINLTGQSGAFISIDSITLMKASYVDIRYEYVNVWERKYIASKFQDQTGQGINLDGDGDYLKYQEDLNTSGQYFAFRSSRFQNQEVIAFDKTKTVSCGIRYLEDETITDVSYDNLHSVESDEQRDLYEYAYNLDPSGDSLTYNIIIPYKYKDFLEELGLIFPVAQLVVESEKLPWTKHYLYKQFKQYDYWRPGGHFYTWSPNFRREKCMIFGGTENVFEGYYAHVDHAGVGNPLEIDPSRPIDPGNSYYSLRFYTQQAKYNRAMILSGGDPAEDDSFTVGGSNIGTFI
jgi:hypothetical protein